MFSLNTEILRKAVEEHNRYADNMLLLADRAEAILPKKKRKCAYCDSVVVGDVYKCPNCGANMG